MMYYRLDVDLGSMKGYVNRENNQHLTLIEGTIMGDDEGAELPFRYSIEAKDGAPVLYDFYPSKNLMRQRLVEALQSAGVNNLQILPAAITNSHTGAIIDDYVVVNVIGMVSCANIDESSTSPLADVYYFHNLVIDPARTRDMLMFRLAESPMEIIIHETVAQQIEAGGFTGLILQPLTEAPAR
jgi:hypothetical protein